MAGRSNGTIARPRLGVVKVGENLESASASSLTSAAVVDEVDRISEGCSGLGEKVNSASCLATGVVTTGARLERAGVCETEVLRLALVSVFFEWAAEFSLRVRSRSVGAEDNSGKSEGENAGVCGAAAVEDATTGEEAGREEETSGEMAARAGETSAADVEGENWGKGGYSDTCCAFNDCMEGCTCPLAILLFMWDRAKPGGGILTKPGGGAPKGACVGPSIMGVWRMPCWNIISPFATLLILMDMIAGSLKPC